MRLRIQSFYPLDHSFEPITFILGTTFATLDRNSFIAGSCQHWHNDGRPSRFSIVCWKAYFVCMCGLIWHGIVGWTVTFLLEKRIFSEAVGPESQPGDTVVLAGIISSVCKTSRHCLCMKVQVVSHDKGTVHNYDWLYSSTILWNAVTSLGENKVI